MREAFPTFGFYWSVLSPLRLDAEAHLGCGDAVDDLADVMLDLSRGLHALYVDGELAAAWTWRFSHRSHWGRHVTDLMAYLLRHLDA